MHSNRLTKLEPLLIWTGNYNKTKLFLGWLSAWFFRWQNSILSICFLPSKRFSLFFFFFKLYTWSNGLNLDLQKIHGNKTFLVKIFSLHKFKNMQNQKFWIISLTLSISFCEIISHLISSSLSMTRFIFLIMTSSDAQKNKNKTQYKIFNRI